MATYTTWDEAKTAYLANADYYSDQSVTKARTFIDACRALLLLQPKAATHGGRGAGESFETVPEVLEREMARALKFVQAVSDDDPGQGSVEYLDLSGWRA